MSITDVPSPGGWLNLYGVRIAKALAIGVAGLTATFMLFGRFNSGQVDHYCEGALATAGSVNGIALSCRNPFASGTGVLLPATDQGIYLGTNPYPADTRASLDAGVALTPTASGNNVFDNVKLYGAKRFLATSQTGTTIRTSGYVAVNSGQYLNFKWGSNTSGATVGGLQPGFVRMKWFNCTDISSSVDC